MISYYYLVAFCPPEHISALKKASEPLRKDLAKLAGLKMADFVRAVAPEVGQRMAAFQQATRQPDQETVDKLIMAIITADISPEKAAEYQALMKAVAIHPGRAKMSQPPAPSERLQFVPGPLPIRLFHLDFRTGFQDPAGHAGRGEQKDRCREESRQRSVDLCHHPPLEDSGGKRGIHQRGPSRQPFLLSVNAGHRQIALRHARSPADPLPGNESGDNPQLEAGGDQG